MPSHLFINLAIDHLSQITDLSHYSVTLLKSCMESIIFNHISEFVVRNISVFQFGFVKHRSSVQRLQLSFDNILSDLNNPINSHVDMMFLDFKKAFDSVSHNELLVKLWHFVITGDLWHWFRAYLTDRKQYVSIKKLPFIITACYTRCPAG